MVSKMFVNGEVVVTPEADEVVFSGVENLLLIRIGEEGRERAQIPQPDRIDDVVGGRGGELDEADTLAVGVQAVGFSIDGHDRMRERAPPTSRPRLSSSATRREAATNLSLPLLDHGSALHHERHALQQPHVVERIAGDRDRSA